VHTDSPVTDDTLVDTTLNPWDLTETRLVRGGPVVVPRSQAPLGQLLPYRRAMGDDPPPVDDRAVRRRGWSVDLGTRGLGDVLLGLAMVRGLAQAYGEPHPELRYEGPRTALMRRSELPLTTEHRPAGHIIHTSTSRPVRFDVVPEHPPTYLDLRSDDQVEVHAALPMRYYLQVEQAVGRRLPAPHAPAPAFTSTVRRPQPFHVVFIATTTMPERKDYGISGFADIATALAGRRSAPWSFTIITPPGVTASRTPFGDLPVEIEAGIDAVDCLEVFASAELVIGNDTGLTHLAALTVRPDGSGPQVMGLYGRHAYTKWTTGSDRHHAAATVFSQMLAAADRCPVRDRLDDSLWAHDAGLSSIDADDVADFCGARTGWW
jgi:hypothetical protein